jgi:hypothetical protein
MVVINVFPWRYLIIGLFCVISTLNLISSLWFVYFKHAKHLVLETSNTHSIKKDFLVGVFTICDSPLRKSIRTWMNNFENETSLMTFKFVLDYDENCIAKLKAENERYNDLLFLHTKKQGYYAIIYKTIAFYKYAAEHDYYKYVIKTDDDAIVHWKKLAEEIKRLDRNYKNVYFGFMKTTPVHSVGKYANPRYIKVTGLSTYPKFANGPMYGVSLNVTKILTKYNEIHELNMWEMDDSTVGHWMTLLDVERIHLPQYAEYGKNCASDKLILHPFKKPGNLENFVQHYFSNFNMACKFFVDTR